MRATRFAIAIALSATQTGCALLNGECTFETRDLHATGQATLADGSVAVASVSVSETRGSLTQGEIHGIVTGSSLSGHVLSAVIKHVAGALPEIQLMVGPAGSSVLAEGGADRKTVNLSDYHDAIAAGKVILQLTTDLPSQGTISITLVPGASTGWIRPNCS